MSLRVSTCSACGKAVFPPRALCPRCGSSGWHRADSGPVRLLAVTERDGVRIAAVATEPGPVVIARLEGTGEALALEDDFGVPVVRAR